MHRRIIEFMGPLPSNFHAQFNDPVLSDIQILVETQRFFASKTILAAWSRPLAVCITNAVKQNPQGFHLRLTSVAPEVVHLMLKFFYTGDRDELEDQLTPRIAWDLLLLSDLLCVTALFDVCQRFLSDWLLRSDDARREHTGTPELSDPTAGELDDEDDLRIEVMLICLHRNRFASDFLILHGSVLHLMMNTPVCSFSTESPKELSPGLGECELVEDVSHDIQPEVPQEETVLVDNPITSRESLAVASVPNLILRLRLTDFCVLLSCDSLKVDEDTLLEWSLAYAAYYGQQLARKFNEDIRQHDHHSSYNGVVASIAPSHTGSHPRSPMYQCVSNSDVIDNRRLKRTRVTTTINEENKMNAAPELASCDPEPTKEVKFNCSSGISRDSIAKNSLIPLQMNTLRFINLCKYFNLSYTIVRRVLEKQFFFKCNEASENSQSDVSSQWVHTTLKVKPYCSISKVSRSTSPSSSHRTNDGTSPKASKEASWLRFISCFFEGYIYASLEPYLRYSLLQPLYLTQMRHSIFCYKPLVTDAVFLQIEKDNPSPSNVPRHSQSLQCSTSLKFPFVTSLLSSLNPPLSYFRLTLPPLLMQYFRNKIYHCVQKNRFHLLPDLLAQYIHVALRRPCLPGTRKPPEQSSISRLTLPFLWSAIDSDTLVISGRLSETVTVRSNFGSVSRWSSILADRGQRSGIHHWLVKINRSLFNNIVIGVKECAMDENWTLCHPSTVEGESRSLLLYNQKIYGINGSGFNEESTNHHRAGYLGSCADERQGSGRPSVANLPVATFTPHTVCETRITSNDIIIVQLDLRRKEGKVSFFCVYYSTQDKSVWDTNGTKHHNTVDGKSRICVRRIGTPEPISATLPSDKEWRLFVNLHDIGDAITLVPYDYAIVNKLPRV